VHIWLRPYATWRDTQTITKTLQGIPPTDVPGYQAANAAWGEVYDQNSSSFPLLTDGATQVTRGSGGDKQCKPPADVDPNCHYSFSATFLARPLPPGG
jgi:hypothetical protein